MKKINILALLAAFTFKITSSLFAQTEGKVFVMEALVCDSTGAAIRDVAVFDAN